MSVNCAEQRHRAEAKRDYLESLIRQLNKELIETKEIVRIWEKESFVRSAELKSGNTKTFRTEEGTRCA